MVELHCSFVRVINSRCLVYKKVPVPFYSKLPAHVWRALGSCCKEHKIPFEKNIAKKCLNEQLNTVLTEMEIILNSGTLLPFLLTPVHFIEGSSLTMYQEANVAQNRLKF